MATRVYNAWYRGDQDHRVVGPDYRPTRHYHPLILQCMAWSINDVEIHREMYREV